LYSGNLIRSVNLKQIIIFQLLTGLIVCWYYQMQVNHHNVQWQDWARRHWSNRIDHRSDFINGGEGTFEDPSIWR